MTLIKVATTILITAVAFALMGIILLALGTSGAIPTILLITSLFIVLAGLCILAVGVWRL
jgi:hypothetical protein